VLAGFCTHTVSDAARNASIHAPQTEELLV
jgi:hypothetical protein